MNATVLLPKWRLSPPQIIRAFSRVFRLPFLSNVEVLASITAHSL